MKKLEKRDYRNLVILISLILIFIIILFFNGTIFGSRVDWANQHVVYPDYFRKLFYETNKLIPSFALNLGSGQNIFYFSYYGLLSPIVIVSYLLPFIPMHIYMPLVSIASLITSVIMFYKWINNKYDSKVALISTLLFLFNSTFFYHFHRHIMFVIYMPFMIGALRSVDLYFSKKKVLPLIIFSFLIIMTNYYFGAYSIIFIGIYTIFNLLKTKKFEFKKLFSIVFYEIIAILLAGVLLIPTIYALLNGRVPTTSTAATNIFDLFLLKSNFDYTFYASYYSWGLLFIHVVAILYGFVSKKREFKFLSLVLSLMILFPIFSYVLNGMMYIDGKCYLAFIPIAMILVSDFIKEYSLKNFDISRYLKYIIILAIILILSALKSNCLLLLITDVIVTTFFLKRSKTKNIYNNFIPIIVIAILSFTFSSFNETYIKIKDYKKLNSEDYAEITKNNDETIYRTAIKDDALLTVNRVYDINSYRTSIYSSLVNKNYFNQFRNVFENEILNRDNYVMSQTSNVLFNIYTGTKYLVSSNTSLIGYEEVNKIGNLVLYENNDVLPIGYVSQKLMSKREFEKLNYPYNMDALLNYVVVDQNLDDVYTTNIEKITLDYEVDSFSNLEYEEKTGHYLINAKKDGKININLKNDLNNKILFIKFKMNKSKTGFACSSAITINNVTNALSCNRWKYHNNNYTFEYVLANTNNLEVKFTQDTFDISDFEFYVMDYNIIRELKNHIQEIPLKKVDDNILKSEVEIDNSGIVKLTIPYEEKGFEVLIDDKKIDIFKVDETYIGFKLDKGNHSILIKYESPYLKEGKIISLSGLVILIITLIVRNKKKLL